MGVKIRRRLTLPSLTRDIKRDFSRVIDEVLETEIKRSIISGVSPVGNFGKFPDYSDEYADIKGVPVTSVDLVLTGDLLNSLSVNTTRAGTIEASFDSKLAEFHNGNSENKPMQGTKLRNGLPVRRILPDRKGEQFSSRIINKLVKAVERIVARAIRKQNT